MRRRPLSIFRALLWLGALVLLLVGADQLERFASYRSTTKKDRGSFLRLARRPVKDALLRTLHLNPPDLGAAKDVPVFDLYMKPEDEHALRSFVALVQVLGTHDDAVTRRWIDARLTIDGEPYDAEVKLRGRAYYHVVPPRPSLRVKLKHDRTYRNMNTFNLIDPFDKTGDQAFLWESEAHDLIGWDTTMGVLALRGEPVGVVQLVEQPRAEMSEHAGRPEGMFFRGSGEIYTEGSDPVRCGKLVKRVVAWLGNTEDTISWEELEELFDVERLRWFTALTELSGDGHGFADFNMKGYCDPVSLKAEMLIWDTRFGDWSKVATSQFAANGAQILRCDRFRALHDQALWELVTERIEPILERTREFNARYAEILREDPMYWFPRGGPDGGLMKDRPEKLERTLAENARAIRAELSGLELDWHVDAARAELELATRSRGPMLVSALQVRAGDGSTRYELAGPVTVYGRYRDRVPLAVLPLPDGLAADAIVGLEARNLCTGEEARAVRSDVPLEGIRVEPAAAPAPRPLPPLPEGFVADATAHEVRIGPGEVHVSGTLTLPRGWNVTVLPGTTILADRGAVLELCGNVRMVGSQAEPIIVRAAGDEPWGTLAILGERTRPVDVEIAHAAILGGAGSNEASFGYTGSLAIYFAKVRMERLEVGDNSSEDALNLKFCDYEAIDCFYHDGASDAFDADFCTGHDLRTRIERFEKDGVEISESKVFVDELYVEEARNNGLSIGENSTPRVLNATVVGARTGCVVKDQSDAVIENLTLVRPTTAVALYVKKRGFMPPHARFSGLVVVDAGAMAIVDQGSRMELDGAVRVGSSAGDMRPFDGLSNVVEPDLAATSDEALVESARRWRIPATTTVPVSASASGR